MTEPKTDRKSWRQEPIASVVAFAWGFVILELLAITVLAGTSVAAPREAALLAIIPCALLAAMCAAYRPTRLTLLTLMPPWNY